MPSMKSEPFTTVSEQLRRAIELAPVSRYKLAQQTGLDQGLLSKFIHGQTGLSLESVDLLAQALGLELRPIKKPRAKKGG